VAKSLRLTLPLLDKFKNVWQSFSITRTWWNTSVPNERTEKAKREKVSATRKGLPSPLSSLHSSLLIARVFKEVCSSRNAHSSYRASSVASGNTLKSVRISNSSKMRLGRVMLKCINKNEHMCVLESILPNTNVTLTKHLNLSFMNFWNLQSLKSRCKNFCYIFLLNFLFKIC